MLQPRLIDLVYIPAPTYSTHTCKYQIVWLVEGLSRQANFESHFVSTIWLHQVSDSVLQLTTILDSCALGRIDLLGIVYLYFNINL